MRCVWSGQVSLEKENAEFKAKITQLEKELADKEGEVTRLRWVSVEAGDGEV